MLTLPSGLPAEELAPGLHLLRLDREQIAAGGVDGLALPEAARWLALARLDLYWVRPHYGVGVTALPREIQLLLWQEADGGYGLLLPLVDAGCRARLDGPTPRRGRWDREGNPRPPRRRIADGFGLLVDGVRAGHAPDGMRAALLGCGADPFALRDRVLAAARTLLGTFRLRHEKPEPPQRRAFGWCSWDAFRRNISPAGMEAAVAGLGAAGAPPRWAIIDDGWQAVRDNALVAACATHPGRLPEGLAPAIAALRAQGVASVGVWHALQGYWQGVHGDGPEATAHPTWRSTGRVMGHQGPLQDLRLVSAAAAAGWYAGWYRWLRSQGVDFTKVDNQGALELFSAGHAEEAAAMATYQRAAQGAAAQHLAQQGLSCMSHGSDVLFHLAEGNWLRNSQDYWKDGPPENHQRFVAKNAVNAFLHGAVAWPDWDMFLSRGPHAAFHALARALSGGPVYTSDGPGAADPALLAQLCLPDGRVPAFDRPAQLLADRLLDDLQRSPRLTILANRSGERFAIGAFHCAHGVPGRIDDGFRLSAIYDLPDHADWVLGDPATGACAPCGRDDLHALSLDPLGAALRVAAPLIDGLAILGDRSRLNGAAGVAVRRDAQGPSAILAGPGELWLYATRPLCMVYGEERRVWPAGTIRLPLRQPVTVVISAG
jgi:raffinose synthase